MTLRSSVDPERAEEVFVQLEPNGVVGLHDRPGEPLVLTGLDVIEGRGEPAGVDAEPFEGMTFKEVVAQMRTAARPTFVVRPPIFAASDH